MRLKDRVILVTGANGGIGGGIVRQLSAEGAKVALCDIREPQGDRQPVEGEIGYFPLDITSPQSWDQVVSDVLASAGRIDGLVNNAGIVNRLQALETDIEAFERVMRVNVTGPFLGIRAVAPVMHRSGGGAIVNVASHSAFTAHYDVSYTTSKWAIRGLTKTTAMELVDWNIRVNAVCPGVVVTGINAHAPHIKPLIDLTPMQRSGQPDEIGKAIGFLLSDDASFITGEDLVVDGGFVSGAAYRDAALKGGRKFPPDVH